MSCTVCHSSYGKMNQLSSNFTFERRALSQPTTTNLIVQNEDYGLELRLFSQPKTTNECIGSIQVSGFQNIKLKTNTEHLHSIYLFHNMATACHSEEQIRIPTYPDFNPPHLASTSSGLTATNVWDIQNFPVLESGCEQQFKSNLGLNHWKYLCNIATWIIDYKMFPVEFRGN